MIYTSPTRPIASFNRDTCFVDIDLTDEKLRNMEAYNRMQTTIQPNMSIWQAAETGNLDVIHYYINNYSSLIQQDSQQKQNRLNEETHENDENDESDDGDSDENEERMSISHYINTRDPNTECTLLYLIVSNNPNPAELLKLLLKQGADVSARNIYNVQIIHILFIRCPEPLASLKLLLDHDADPNARDGDGWTPVHYASRFCKEPLPVIQLLIAHGADVNAVDNVKKTCLFGLLANGDHTQTLDWLIHIAKVNLKVTAEFQDNQTRRTKKGSLLLQAAKYGRLGCLRILISSTLSMDSLESIITLDELKLAIELVRQQLVKVTERDDIERLGVMIMIFENLIQKLSSKKNETISPVDSEIKRKPSLLKRMVSWGSKK